MKPLIPLLLAGLLLLPGLAAAQTGPEVARKAHLAAYYAATDGRAQMLMQVYRKGAREPITKLFTMLKLDLEDGGRQMFYTLFASPSDIRRTAFLVHKYVDRDDFRRLYIPASDKVLAISGARKQDPFMGSDFSYEDVSGRHFSKDTHTLLGEETRDGRPHYVLESVPREREDKLARMKSWIDKETFLPMRVEFYGHDGQAYKVYESSRVMTFQGHPTIMVRTMTSPLAGTRTVILVNPKNIAYDIGLSEVVFAERSLRNPPLQFLQ